MNLNELYPFAEDRKSRKRVGRGSGSGLGCTSGPRWRRCPPRL